MRELVSYDLFMVWAIKTLGLIHFIDLFILDLFSVEVLGSGEPGNRPRPRARNRQGQHCLFWHVTTTMFLPSWKLYL